MESSAVNRDKKTESAADTSAEIKRKTASGPDAEAKPKNAAGPDAEAKPKTAAGTAAGMKRKTVTGAKTEAKRKDAGAEAAVNADAVLPDPKKRVNDRVSFFVRLALFAVLFGWLFVHVSYAKRPELAHSRNNISGFYAEEKDSLDVVFIGTSGTMSSFMPMDAFEECGFTSYNLCTNEMQVEGMLFAMHEMQKTQNPRLLVLDVRPFIVENSMYLLSREDEGNANIRFNTDGYKYSLDRVRYIWQNLPHNIRILNYVFDIAKYHREPLNLDNWNGEHPFLYRGYNFLGWGDEINLPVQTEEEMPIGEFWDAKLDELMDEAEKLDAEVLFLYYPYALSPLYPNALERVNYIQRRVTERGFAFLDCEEHFDEYDLDVKLDFWNNGHFNVYGAKKITAWMAPYLASAYSLPDHREDPAYGQWNADLRKWHRAVKKWKKTIKKASRKAG